MRLVLFSCPTLLKGWGGGQSVKEMSPNNFFCTWPINLLSKKQKTNFLCLVIYFRIYNSVSDPLHFDADPLPG